MKRIVPLLLLAGCSSPEPALVTSRPLAKPEALVRHGEVVAQYQVGRYVDRQNVGLMHEAHPVYRLEVPSGWDLRPATPRAPGGERLNEELVAELNRQRQFTSAVMEQAGRLEAALHGLEAATGAARALAQQGDQLQERIEAIAQRLEVLEGRVSDFGPTSEARTSGGL